MPKKPAPEPENHERWLVSYADFITLLFAFFVVMFASSQTDKARAKQVSEAVEKALEDGHSISVPPAVAKILGGTVDDKGQGNAMMKGPGGAQHSAKESQPENIVELLPSLERLNKELAQEIKDGKLELRLEPRGLVISLRQSAFFPSGQDNIDEANLPTMKKLAELIGTLPNQSSWKGTPTRYLSTTPGSRVTGSSPAPAASRCWRLCAEPSNFPARGFQWSGARKHFPSIPTKPRKAGPATAAWMLSL